MGSRASSSGSTWGAAGALCAVRRARAARSPSFGGSPPWPVGAGRRAPARTTTGSAAGGPAAPPRPAERAPPRPPPAVRLKDALRIDGLEAEGRVLELAPPDARADGAVQEARGVVDDPGLERRPRAEIVGERGHLVVGEVTEDPLGQDEDVVVDIAQAREQLPARARIGEVRRGPRERAAGAFARQELVRAGDDPRGGAPT